MKINTLKPRVSAIVLLCILTCLLPHQYARAQQTEVIIWRTTNWPPAYNLEGPEKGQGIYDKLITLFKREMPDIHHLDVAMNTRRAFQQMNTAKGGVAVCHASVIKRQGEKHGVLSNLNSILLTHVVVIRRELVHMLDEVTDDRSVVSLEKLINTPSLRGGIASFGTHPFLEKYESRAGDMPNLVYIPEAYDTLIRMLLSGRIDYLVQYQPMIEYVEKKSGYEGSTVAVKIKETLDDPFVRVYTACSPNELGKKAITHINQAMKKAGENGELRKIQLQIYSGANRKILEGLYDEETP